MGFSFLLGKIRARWRLKAGFRGAEPDRLVKMGLGVWRRAPGREDKDAGALELRRAA